jgi:hypothetical protein
LDDDNTLDDLNHVHHQNIDDIKDSASNNDNFNYNEPSEEEDSQNTQQMMSLQGFVM